MNFPKFSFKPKDEKEAAASNRKLHRDQNRNKSHRDRDRTNRESDKPLSQDHHSRAHYSPDAHSHDHHARDQTRNSGTHKDHSNLYKIDLNGDENNLIYGVNRRNLPKYDRYTTSILGVSGFSIIYESKSDHEFIVTGNGYRNTLLYSAELPKIEKFPTRVIPDKQEFHGDVGADFISLDDSSAEITSFIDGILRTRRHLQYLADSDPLKIEGWIRLLEIEETLQKELQATEEQSTEIISTLLSNICSKIHKATEKIQDSAESIHSGEGSLLWWRNEYPKTMLGLKILSLNRISLDSRTNMFYGGTISYSRWKDLALKHPYIPEFWKNWIDTYIRAEGPRDKQKMGYLQAFVQLCDDQGLMKQYDNLRMKYQLKNSSMSIVSLAYSPIVSHIACLLKNAGFWEIAASLIQACIERSFFSAPHGDENSSELDFDGESHFKKFWNSEMPRFSEFGAKGWYETVHGRDYNHSELTDSIATRSYCPLFNDSGSINLEKQQLYPNADCFSVVLLDDISGFIRKEPSNQLILSYFDILGCSLLDNPANFLNADIMQKNSKFVDNAIEQISQSNFKESLGDILIWYLDYKASTEPESMLASMRKIISISGKFLDSAECQLILVHGTVLLYRTGVFPTEANDYYLSIKQDNQLSYRLRRAAMILVCARVIAGEINSQATPLALSQYFEESHSEDVRELLERFSWFEEFEEDEATRGNVKNITATELDNSSTGIISNPYALELSKTIEAIVLRWDKIWTNVPTTHAVVLAEAVLKSLEQDSLARIHPFRLFYRKLSEYYPLSVEIETLVIRFQDRYGRVLEDFTYDLSIAHHVAWFIFYKDCHSSLIEKINRGDWVPSQLFIVFLQSELKKHSPNIDLSLLKVNKLIATNYDRYRTDFVFMDMLLSYFRFEANNSKVNELENELDNMLLRRSLMGNEPIAINDYPIKATTLN